MTGRIDLATQPTQRCPNPGSGVCGARIARGDAMVMAMQRFAPGAVHRDGNSAT
jgi:hypothetical protein